MGKRIDRLKERLSNLRKKISVHRKNYDKRKAESKEENKHWHRVRAWRYVWDMWEVPRDRKARTLTLLVTYASFINVALILFDVLNHLLPIMAIPQLILFIVVYPCLFGRLIVSKAGKKAGLLGFSQSMLSMLAINYMLGQLVVTHDMWNIAIWIWFLFWDFNPFWSVWVSLLIMINVWVINREE